MLIIKINAAKAINPAKIVADKTSDEKILRALRNKIDISSQVLAEGYKDWII